MTTIYKNKAELAKSLGVRSRSICGVKEACKRLSITSDTLRYRAERGQIPRFRAPGRMLYYIPLGSKLYNKDGSDNIIRIPANTDNFELVELVEQAHPDCVTVKDISHIPPSKMLKADLLAELAGAEAHIEELEEKLKRYAMSVDNEIGLHKELSDAQARIEYLDRELLELARLVAKQDAEIEYLQGLSDDTTKPSEEAAEIYLNKTRRKPSLMARAVRGASTVVLSAVQGRDK